MQSESFAVQVMAGAQWGLVQVFLCVRFTQFNPILQLIAEELECRPEVPFRTFGKSFGHLPFISFDLQKECFRIPAVEIVAMIQQARRSHCVRGERFAPKRMDGTERELSDMVLGCINEQDNIIFTHCERIFHIQLETVAACHMLSVFR